MCTQAVFTSSVLLRVIPQSQQQQPKLQLLCTFTILFKSRIMPPRSPLPDLCLIAVFKMMPPNDQLKASLMAPRCALLVRAANRSVKTLIITDDDFTKNRGIIKAIKCQINFYSLASMPSMQQLMDAGETFPSYLMPITHLSKWNCLHIEPNLMLDIASTTQITSVFSAVTDLILIGSQNDLMIFLENSITLMDQPTWKRQLTNLMVNEIDLDELPHRLITAINGLTALQQLTIDLFDYPTDAPDLTILAQLKVVVFSSFYLTSFLLCLERQAAGNAHLQVHLIDCGGDDLLHLSEPLRSRIVRYDKGPLDYNHDQVPLLCSQFRSLTTLSIRNIESTQVVLLFTALSQLQQLIHLKVGVDFSQNEEKEIAPPPRSLAQLNTLRALDLRLTITSHSQIEWLNLTWKMPNLKAIFIEQFSCDNCKVWFDFDQANSPPLSSPEALVCFRPSLFHLHSGVPLKQFILHSNKERTSVEKLLLQSE